MRGRDNVGVVVSQYQLDPVSVSGGSLAEDAHFWMNGWILADLVSSFVGETESWGASGRLRS